MSTPADIAILIHSLAGGGAERACLGLAEGFQARGLSVDLVLCRAEGALMGAVPEGVRLVDCAARGSRSWRRAMIGYFADRAPRTLLAAMEGAGIVALSARAAAHAPTRIYVTSHTTYSVHRRQAGWKERWLQPIAARALLPRADGLFGVSESGARDLERSLGLPEGRVATLWNPVVTPAFLTRAGAPPRHPWLSGPREAPVIVGAGRLTPQKDFETLIRAVAMLDRPPPPRLILYGEGEDRGPLEALGGAAGLGDRLSMPGFTDNLGAELAAADLFALSSRHEGLPTVLIEAMACGCPVVSTDCPSGPREILEGGAHGRLVPVGDPGALAQAISATLAGPPDPVALRSRGAAFSLSASVEAHLTAMGLVPPGA